MLKVAIIVYVLLSIFLFDPKLYTGGDNVNYLILAKSITTGQGYKDIHRPTQPQHRQYPVGLPLVLAPFWNSLFLSKIIIVLFGVGSLFYFYGLCKKLFKSNYWIPVIFFLTTPVLYFYNHYILTEIPFLFFVLGALYYASTLRGRSDLAAVGFAAAACLMRSVGIGLLLAIMLHYTITKRYFSMLISQIATILVLLFTQKGSYFTQIIAQNPYNLSEGTLSIYEIIARFWHNFSLYFGQILPSSVYPDMHSSIVAIYSFILIAIIGYAVYVLWKKEKVIVFYFLTMTGIILAWPTVWASDRFLIPIIPIVIIFLGVAFCDLAKKKSKVIKIVVSIILPICIIYNCTMIVKGGIVQTRLNFAYLQGDRLAGYTQDWRNYFNVCEQLPDEKCTVIARKPEFVYWLSGNKSNIYRMDNDMTKIQSQLAGYDYVIVDSFQWTSSTDHYLIPALKHNDFGKKFRAVYKTESPEFYLLKRI